jgi:hypothetical protein
MVWLAVIRLGSIVDAARLTLLPEFRRTYPHS